MTKGKKERQRQGESQTEGHEIERKTGRERKRVRHGNKMKATEWKRQRARETEGSLLCMENITFALRARSLLVCILLVYK